MDYRVEKKKTYSLGPSQLELSLRRGSCTGRLAQSRRRRRRRPIRNVELVQTDELSGCAELEKGEHEAQPPTADQPPGPRVRCTH